ncbi:UBX11 protein, partial [Chloropsis hardwickii]|nr:UBX11 protein [Chloropsis hardwickii]
AAHADVELVSSLAEKISLLEQKLEKQAQEIQLKDGKIAELEERIKTLQEGEDASDSSTTEELETRCLELQSQVWEMERFLNDYGLVWVGETREQLGDAASVQHEEELPARHLCKPGKALWAEAAGPAPSACSEKGELDSPSATGNPGHSCHRTRAGQPGKAPREGIVQSSGTGVPCKPCITGLVWGLHCCLKRSLCNSQICLQVTDRRDVVFQKPELPGSFPGQGQVVGTSGSNRVQESSKNPGKILNLPQKRSSVLRKRILKPYQGSDGQQSSKKILVEAPGLAALDRVKPAGGAGAPAPDCCTLRIRSESGEQTYEVRMLLTDTIGDLRQRLAHIRGGNSDYEIISTFPQRVYTDNSSSLQECGLVPSASLLLRRRDPSQQEGRGLQTA